jgi:hypothetical protein
MPRRKENEMPKTDAYEDEEVREYLDHLPRHLTFSEMADACVRRFGATRAWSRPKIIRYWDFSHPVHKGKAARVDSDDELREFLDDHLGRMTLEKVTMACKDKFGSERSPSRSAIHRYWKNSRRTRSKA